MVSIMIQRYDVVVELKHWVGARRNTRVARKTLAYPTWDRSWAAYTLNTLGGN